MHDDSVHYFVLVDQLEWQTGGSVNGGQLDVFGKPDPEREIGAGLSPAGAGLRLRYEIRGELAPYVGVSWTANSSARLISPGRREKTPAEPLWCLVFGHGSDSARVENRARVSSGGRINVERCGVKCGLMRSRHPPAEPCRQSHARTRHRNLLPG